MATRRSAVKRIVAGVDGSDAGKLALEWTARLAKTLHSEVVAVYAIEEPIAVPDPYAIPFYLDDKWRARIAAGFPNKWGQPLEGAGVEDRASTQDGGPPPGVLDVAARGA